MTSALIITGTDTGVGKTVVSAVLTLALRATYWKPVQSGCNEETDSETVSRLTDQPVLPETYRLQTPASPHFSAAAEGVIIKAMPLPDTHGPLVVEGAGGALVPLRNDLLYADLMACWKAPVVVVARTSLGTINHSLLTIATLKARDISVLGVVFVGDEVTDSQEIICRISKTRSLGRLPVIPHLNRSALVKAAQNLDLAAIAKAL